MNFDFEVKYFKIKESGSGMCTCELSELIRSSNAYSISV